VSSNPTAPTIGKVKAGEDCKVLTGFSLSRPAKGMRGKIRAAATACDAPFDLHLLPVAQLDRAPAF
jgi:hypothetical protein